MSNRVTLFGIALLLLNPYDTIVGIATPGGGALRGVVRVSGPETLAALSLCFRSRDADLQTIRRARVVPGDMQLGDSLGELPGELYVWPGERSYTKQPSAEFHTLGSPPLLEAVVNAICRAGGRLAGPGEFTMRAFLSGRLDLTQAEAVLGVIDAQDRSGLDTALAQLAGGLSHPLNALRGELLDLLADLEAGLDFVDEDIEFIDATDLQDRLLKNADHLSRLEGRLQSRSLSDDESAVVLYGYPNVGKSSLFNVLANDAAALVSDQEGTTRDYLTRRIHLDGLVVRLVDTAGKEATASRFGRAQSLADEQTQSARVRVLCLDGTRHMNDWEKRESATPDDSLVIVVTKADQGAPSIAHRDAVMTSARSGFGLDRLKAELRRRLEGPVDRMATAVPATSVRCSESVRLAADAILHARDLAAADAGDELVAAELRIALDELGRIVGEVYTDDILDRIFSRFCIGK